MEVEDDRLVDREQRVEIAIREAIGMFSLWLQFEKINDIDKTNLQVWNFFPEKNRGRERLLCGNIARRGKNNIRLSPLVIAGLCPNADALGTVPYGCIEIQILQMQLLITDEHIYVVLAAQAMIDDGQGENWQLGGDISL